MTPSGIDSATFRFVAHFINQLHHRQGKDIKSLYSEYNIKN